MEDHYERFPQQLTDEQQQAILDQLNAAQEKLRQNREEEQFQEVSQQPQEPPQGQEYPSEYDASNFLEGHTEAEPSQKNPQEQADSQWQDTFEGLSDPEPGRHTTSEFERLARAGFEQETFTLLEGNEVTIRTLIENEEDESLIRASRHPAAFQSRAYGIYRAASALMAIEGKPWYRKKPLSKDEDLLEEKFNALRRWHPPLLDTLINRLNVLQGKLLEKAQYAGKGSETTGSGES